MMMKIIKGVNNMDNDYKSLNEYMNQYQELPEMLKNLLTEAKKRQEEQKEELEKYDFEY
jgi:hypothetical protein